MTCTPVVMKLVYTVFEYAEYTIPLTLFFVRSGSAFMQSSATHIARSFLEWYYHNEPRAQLQPIIPETPKSPLYHRTFVIPDALGTCPVCMRTCVNPTALMTSGTWLQTMLSGPISRHLTGHVFCYGCIQPYVTKHGRCPVTLAGTDDSQLIRLYVNQ